MPTNINDNRLAENLELRLEDPDLAWFVEGTPEFGAYITGMLWARDYIGQPGPDDG